jgi:serine protease Do
MVADADAARVGSFVVAIGHPFGVRGALTAGIIHAMGPIMPGGRPWIQADVRLAPGNSGGPLADASGHVVGLNAMIVGALALAIPISRVTQFVRAAGVEPM